MTPTAVLYCRVSTKEQTQNLSLPTQLKACSEYCERNGYAIGETFIEEGESAKTADRPELKRLLSPSIPSWNHILSFLQQMSQLREHAGSAA